MDYYIFGEILKYFSSLESMVCFYSIIPYSETLMKAFVHILLSTHPLTSSE